MSKIFIPFYTNKNGVLSKLGEYAEVDVDIITQIEEADLFALKPNVNIGRDAITIDGSKILVFNKSNIVLHDRKIYLILVADKLFLKRCKIENSKILFEDDKSKQLNFYKDVDVLGKLVFSLMICGEG